MKRTRERPQGRLRVDVPVAFGRHLLMPALPQFTARYPDLSLEIQYNDRVVDLIQEEVDVAVRVGPVTRQESRRAPRVPHAHAHVRLAACISPKHGVPETRTICASIASSGCSRTRMASRGQWYFQSGATTEDPEAAFRAGLQRPRGADLRRHPRRRHRADGGHDGGGGARAAGSSRSS